MIYSYTPRVDAYATHAPSLPADAVQHGAIDGRVYVSCPTDAPQDANGVSVRAEPMTDSLLAALMAISPHVALAQSRADTGAVIGTESGPVTCDQQWLDAQMVAWGLVIGPPTAAEIRAERDRRVQTGGYQAAGKWFHSDQISRIQQIGLVMMGAAIPTGLRWKTMDGTFVTMTQPLAGAVFQAAAAQDAAHHAACEAALAALAAGALSSLADITWPPIYLPA